VRIFFGVGGPNYTSSFHVIGEIFDKVYPFGGLQTPPLEGIQTVSVAPGGAVITEFKTQVPGNYTLVDHALARAERGLSGMLSVEGPPNPEIYNGKVMPGMGHRSPAQYSDAARIRMKRRRIDEANPRRRIHGRAVQIGREDSRSSR
jgi:FtsP/CotA-like multicopper oxidase with cupredoxin domain